MLHDPVPAGDAGHRARLATLPAGLRFRPEQIDSINLHYLGDAAPDTRYAFAGLGPVAGLPPTLLTICEYDDLAPSGLDHADQLRAAGVPVEVELVRGVTHGHLNIAGLPEALGSLAVMARFLATRAGAS